MTSRRRSLVVTIAVAVLMAGLSVDAPAKKRKPKNTFTATVNGKTIKFTKNVRFTAGGSTVAFMAIAQTKPRRNFFRQVSVACGDFPPAAVPGTSMFCTAQYMEEKFGRHTSIKTWFRPSTTDSVTFSSYDGTHVEGTFTDPDLPSITGDPPVALEGHFAGTIAGSN